MVSLFRRRFDGLTESPLVGNPLDLDRAGDRLEPTSHTVSKRSSSAQPLSTEPSNSRRDRRRSSKGKASKSKNKLVTRRSFVDAVAPSAPLAIGAPPTPPLVVNPSPATPPSSTSPVTPSPDTNSLRIAVNDTAVVEGNSWWFTVSISQGEFTRPVTVDYELVSRSAIASQDYSLETRASSRPSFSGPMTSSTGKGTITFNPGYVFMRETFVAFFTLPDQFVEGNETFSIRLSNPTNAVIEDGEGIAIIQDNDNLLPDPRITVVGARSYKSISPYNDRSAAMSADGRYVAYSLFANASATVPDVFLYDRTTGTSRLISQRLDGIMGANATNPSISDDGQIIVFQSQSVELVPNPNRLSSETLFVYNQVTQQMRQIPIPVYDLESFRVSGDGQTVFIDTRDTGSFFYNIQTNTLERANLQADIRSLFASSGANIPPYGLSRDARYLTYVVSNNLFVYDRVANTTTPLGLNISLSNEDPSTETIKDPFMSADGRYVAFSSRALNLVEGATTQYWNIYLYDRETKTTTRVTDGAPSVEYFSRLSGSFNPVISNNNRFIAFSSAAANLVPSDTNRHIDVFVYDRETQKTERVSVARDGTQANYDSGLALSISADGQFIAFNSAATNLTPYNLGTIDFPSASTTRFNAYYVVDREAQ